jgi:hypothetical protein
MGNLNGKGVSSDCQMLKMNPTFNNDNSILYGKENAPAD